MLRDELVRQGNVLFRYRSYLPFLLLPAAALSQTGSLTAGTALDQPWRLVCLVIALAGILLRAYVAGTIPAGTSGRNTAHQIATDINMRGLYSVVRHPLYFANFVVCLGFILATGNVWFVGFGICAFWLYYERIMLAEEAFLACTHGERYRTWASETPAFFPRLSGWQSPDLPFSIRAALLREFHSVFQAVAVFALLALAEAILVRSLPLRIWVRSEPLWPGLFVASLMFYLVVRAIKKKTTWLRVEGR